MRDCLTGKRPYANGTDAAREARKLARNCKGGQLRPYRCPFCSQYHLGNGTGARSGNFRHEKRRRYLESFA